MVGARHPMRQPDLPMSPILFLGLGGVPSTDNRIFAFRKCGVAAWTYRSAAMNVVTSLITSAWRVSNR
jgi:hypothetical protein